MKKIIKILTVSMFVGSALCAGTVYAQSYEGRDYDVERLEKKKERIKKFKNKMSEELGLSNEQRQKFEENRKGQREQGKQYRESLRNLREQMRAELQKADFNESTVRSLQSQIKDIQSKMADHRLNGILEVRKSLTPEQFQKFSEMRKEHKGKRKERWGNRGKGADNQSDQFGESKRSGY